MFKESMIEKDPHLRKNSESESRFSSGSNTFEQSMKDMPSFSDYRAQLKTERNQKMGSKVERVAQNVEKAKEIEAQGIEQAEKDASEISEVKGILEGMDKNVDEDILSAIEATREAAKSEGANHMQSDVHNTLEQGYNSANDAIQEGTEQSAKSREAASEFQSVSGASEFGRSTAESSASTAENVADQLDGHVETAQQDMNNAENNFQKLLDEIIS